MQDGCPLMGMRDLGVELERVEAAALVGHAGDGAAGGAGHELEAGRQVGDLVTVAHPDAEHAVAMLGGEVCDVAQELRVAMGPDLGVAELAAVAPGDGAAELHGHGLHAVADAEDGDAELEDGGRCAELVVFVGGGVAPREDDAAGVEFGELLVGDIGGIDLAIYRRLTHSSCNELGDLRPEVENENSVLKMAHL